MLNNNAIQLNDVIVNLTQAGTGKGLSFFRDDIMYVLAGENGSLLKLKDDDTVWEVDEIVELANLKTIYGAK